MELHRRPRLGLPVASFLVALLLGVVPLPQGAAWFRPEFVALLVIYWTMALPDHMGVGMAFIVGLLQDLVESSALGQHALALVVVAYVCVLSYRRIRNYALWQQSGWVFILVGIHQLFWNWVNSLTGPSAQSLIFLLPALISALIWPLVLLSLRWLSRRNRQFSF
ncbi:rod shape-determining protein MreD [Gilvimarinus sp. F26214L]|uniref:rod shape-determining protein MreD n=1 Tax=Gilvimarinus sp. DZF01 TaxID=3461371 RepID=UPI0040466E32